MVDLDDVTEKARRNLILLSAVIILAPFLGVTMKEDITLFGIWSASGVDPRKIMGLAVVFQFYFFARYLSLDDTQRYLRNWLDGINTKMGVEMNEPHMLAKLKRSIKKSIASDRAKTAFGIGALKEHRQLIDTLPGKRRWFNIVGYYPGAGVSRRYGSVSFDICYNDRGVDKRVERNFHCEYELFDYGVLEVRVRRVMQSILFSKYTIEVMLPIAMGSLGCVIAFFRFVWVCIVGSGVWQNVSC